MTVTNGGNNAVAKRAKASEAAKKFLAKAVQSAENLKVTNIPPTPTDLQITQVRRSMVEFMERTDAEWVDIKKVYLYVERFFVNSWPGGDASRKDAIAVFNAIINKGRPALFVDKCPEFQFRRRGTDLDISIRDAPMSIFFSVYDKLKKGLEEIRRKQKEKRKRDLKEAQKSQQEPPNKKQKCGSESPKKSARGKVYKLKECCAIYNNADFAMEMGVLNESVTVKIDLTTLTKNRVKMVHPIVAWCAIKDLPVAADDVVQCAELEYDSCDEEEITGDPDSFSFLLLQQTRVYRHKIATVACEIGTLNKHLTVTVDRRYIKDGWARVISPLEGWCSVFKLKPPKITPADLAILKKHKEREEARRKAKEAAIVIDSDGDGQEEKTEAKTDAAAEVAGAKDVEMKDSSKTADGKPEDSNTTDKSKEPDTEEPKKPEPDEPEDPKAKESTKAKEAPEPETEVPDTDKSQETKGGESEKPEGEVTQDPKDNKNAAETQKTPNGTKSGDVPAAEEKQTEETVNGAVVDDKQHMASENSEEDDANWEPVENLDADTVSGVWSCGSKGGAFNFTQEADGTIDGYLDSKTTCAIEGKIEGNEMEFQQIWQQGSVHGAGVKTVVKGKVQDGCRTLNLSFECKNRDGKTIVGKNILRKRPASDVSGVWYSEDKKKGAFTFKMDAGGAITGFLDSSSICRITGRLSAHRITAKQNWQLKVKPFQICTDVEGYVNDKGTKMTLTFTHTSPEGKSITGTRTLRKQTSHALAGMWVSGDRGGKFIFEASRSNSFTGYLDSKKTCNIEGTVQGFNIKFRQLWLDGSSHAGAVAEVDGKGNMDLSKMELSFTCKKPDGTTLSGKSTLSKMRVTENKTVPNELFSGTHSEFPPGVFNRMPGVKLFPGQEGIGRFNIYSRMQKILILGEADFSFTLAMTRQFKKTYTTLVGSSYMLKWGQGKPPPSWNQNPRKRQFLNEVVRALDPVLDEIVERGGCCRFGVDARALKKSLHSESVSCTKWAGTIPEDIKFDRIIFPFPRASLSRFDPVEDTDLIQGLFRSAQTELTPNGELHVIFHTSRQGISQVDLWNIRDLAEQEDMIWRGALPFDPKKMPRYQPKDVTGTPWRAFEPMLHIFTPRYSQWKPEHLLSIIR